MHRMNRAEVITGDRNFTAEVKACAEEEISHNLVALDRPRILHSILPNNTQKKLVGKLPLTAEQITANVD